MCIQAVATVTWRQQRYSTQRNHSWIIQYIGKMLFNHSKREAWESYYTIH